MVVANNLPDGRPHPCWTTHKTGKELRARTVPASGNALGRALYGSLNLFNGVRQYGNLPVAALPSEPEPIPGTFTERAPEDYPDTTDDERERHEAAMEGQVTLTDTIDTTPDGLKEMHVEE